MRHWRASVIALLLAVALPLPTSPAQAAADLTASITAMEPALPAAGDAIVLNVQVANPTDQGITGISATFLVSTSPLVGRSQIPDVLSGKLLPTYRLLEDASATDIDLPAGASTTLTLRTTPRALGLSSNRPGVYLLGVRLQGRMSGSAVRVQPVTLLPWMPDPSAGTLDVMTVWTLTAPPTRGPDGVFVNDVLARSLSSGGRLREQLTQMSGVGNALWLLDPLLVESAQALAGGARIRTADGERGATGDEMQAASTWIKDLKQAVTTGRVAAMPLGDFDVRAALKFQRLTLLRHAVGAADERLAAALGLQDVPLAVPIYGGGITNSSWRFLTQLGASIAIVSDLGYPATQSRYTSTTGLAVADFRGRVLVTDQAIDATPVDADGTQARQAFASQLLMTSLERPNSDRVITVATVPDWQPHANVNLASVLNADWIRHVGPSDARAAGTDDRGFVQNPATTAQRRQNARASLAVEYERTLRRLTADPAFTSTVADGVSGMLSRWWTARVVRDLSSPTISAQLEDFSTSVRVITRGDIVFGGETGKVPVTIANGLPVGVDIVLQATGIPTVRVKAREATAVHLNAGKRVSVEIPTQVTGSGDSYLMLQLATKDGAFISQPALLTVRSAAYARVASYLVAVAFAVLLLLIAVNTVRRVRLRRAGVVEDE